VISLHPYQDQIIAEARTHLRQGIKSVLIQAPTGSGKTVLTAFMAGTASNRGRRVWFGVHRRELIKQSIRTFSYVGIPHGVIAAGFMADRRPLVQIASVQTVGRRLGRLERPDIIVWDECHHLAAGTWAAIYNAYPDALHIGLSATPERLDGAGLGAFFERMVRGPDVGTLIEQGYLSPYRLYAPKPIDLSGVHTKLGDFVKGELAQAMDRPTITGDAIAHYRRYADGKRAVAFCCSIEHSRHVVAQFQAAGIPAEHVDGETDNAVRDAAIQRFERGETRVLSNVELFGEGFDLPAIEAAILLRPTQSLALYLQQCGRALRVCEGKAQAIILDHAGNSHLHGLPDDPREWTLEGRKKKKRAADAPLPIRTCPKCFAALPAAVGVCKYCGAVLGTSPREVEEVAGELVEVDPKVLRRQRMREQARAATLEDLVAIGKSRGYRAPEKWAAYVWNARQQKGVAA